MSLSPSSTPQRNVYGARASHLWTCAWLVCGACLWMLVLGGDASTAALATWASAGTLAAHRVLFRGADMPRDFATHMECLLSIATVSVALWGQGRVTPVLAVGITWFAGIALLAHWLAGAGREAACENLSGSFGGAA